MTAEESAYAALGLRRGAGRAEVDEAYRRLIKRFHPDMNGGDAARAAEINRAYTQLRRWGAASSVRPQPRVPVPVRARPRPKGRRTGWILVGAAAIVSGLAIANDEPRRGSSRSVYTVPLQWTDSSDEAASPVEASPFAQFEEPLQAAVIDRAIADAVRLKAQGDSAATAEFSRACYNRLRRDPSLTWFDSCAAFDEATIALSTESPFADSGQFDASSVVARQMGAARMLSHDMLAVDSRLHQIRSRVELALLPRLDEPPADTL